MIEDIRHFTGYGIRPICDALGVPRSSYYHAAEPTPTQRSDQQLGDMIQAIFKSHRRRYGYRRIWEELADQGIICAADRVRRIMRNVDCGRFNPRPTCPGPATDAPTNPHQTSS